MCTSVISLSSDIINLLTDEVTCMRGVTGIRVKIENSLKLKINIFLKLNLKSLNSI